MQTKRTVETICIVKESNQKQWHKTVYHKHINDFDMNREDWRELRKACLQRDHYKCYRCEKKSYSGKGLGTHHILPRALGGSDDITNLITLCHKCHDFVEISGFTTKIEIKASIDEVIEEEPKEIEEPEIITLDWHSWVYGGARRPPQDHRFSPNALNTQNSA